MEDRCIICGCVIPEGIQICPKCWKETMEDDDNENNESSHLKTSCLIGTTNDIC